MIMAVARIEKHPGISHDYKGRTLSVRLFKNSSNNTFHMNKINLAAILFFLITLSGCQAIGDIFKAGVWVGILGVVLVLILIFWLIGRAKNK